MSGFADVAGKVPPPAGSYHWRRVDHLVVLLIQNIKYQFWDTAGQSKFRPPLNSCTKHVCGVLLVYSVVDRASFEACPTWIEQVRPLLSNGVPILLLGSKTDLSPASKEATHDRVTMEEAQLMAEKHGAEAWEASALRQTGAVEVVFSEILRLALKWKLKSSMEEKRAVRTTDVSGLAARLDSLETETEELIGTTIQAEDGAVLWLCPKCGWGQEHSKREAEPQCDRCFTEDRQSEKEVEAAPAVVEKKGVMSNLVAALSQGCMERQSCKPDGVQ